MFFHYARWVIVSPVELKTRFMYRAQVCLLIEAPVGATVIKGYEGRAIMCGVGNFVTLVMLLFLTPVFAFLINTAGSSVIRMYIPQGHKENSRRIWKFASVIIALLIPVGFLISPDPRLEKRRAESEALRNKQYAEYWDKFSQLEENLFAARTESDPAILKMKALGHDFKLGPCHAGRRELALNDSCYYCWLDNKTVDGLEGAMPEALRKRWYVGRGFSKATEKENRWLYIQKDGKSRCALDNEFSVSAKRNGKRIDVDLYTDFPPSDYGGHMPGEETYAKECLGEEAFHRYLGTITVHSRSQEPANAKLDTNLEKAFTAQLTNEERKELRSIITALPCVVWVPVIKHDKESTVVTGSISPYITLRHL